MVTIPDVLFACPTFARSLVGGLLSESLRLLLLLLLVSEVSEELVAAVLASTVCVVLRAAGNGV